MQNMPSWWQHRWGTELTSNLLPCYYMTCRHWLFKRKSVSRLSSDSLSCNTTHQPFSRSPRCQPTVRILELPDSTTGVSQVLETKSFSLYFIGDLCLIQQYHLRTFLSFLQNSHYQSRQMLPYLQSLETTNLVCISMYLPALRVSHKRNHKACGISLVG